jgi:hypothetical protein
MENYTQIYLKDFGYLDVIENIPLSTTYTLADVKDISKRNSSFTKTILLPGTKNNNEILGLIFEVNIRFNDCTYKINRKVEAVILQNGQPILSGWFKLLNINKVSPSDISFDENIQYEAVVFSNQTGVYDRIKDLDITDINFSAYNHTLSISAVTGSTLHTYEDVYKYIWHYTSDNKYTLGDFRPSIFAKPIFDKIFLDAGFSYSWNANSDTFQKFSKLLIPPNTRDLLISDEEVQARSFRVSFNSGYTVNNINSFTKTPNNTFTSGVALYGGYSLPTNLTSLISNPFITIDYVFLQFNNDTIGSNFDGSYDNYSTSSYTFNVKKNGQYEFDLNLAGKINITADRDVFFPQRVFSLNQNDSRQLGDNGEPALAYTVEFLVASAGTNTYQIVNSYFRKYAPQMVQIPVPQYYSGGITQPGFLSGTTSYDYSFICPKFLLDLSVGDKVIVRIKMYTYATTLASVQYETLVGQRIRKIQWNVTINDYNPLNSFWRVNAVKNNLTTGDEIDISTMLPQKLKQVEFIKSIVNMFNLYLIPDDNDKNNIIIKTRDEYYADAQGEYVDWTDKIDYSQQYQLQLLSELQNKTLNYTYKNSDDDVNKKYLEQTGFLYGQYKLNFDNDFLNGEQRFELMFEPTPLVKTLVPLGDEGSTFIVPYLVYGKNANPKILYDGGAITTLPYQIVDGTTTYNLTSYNYAGHFDNPTNPTFDINWNTNEYYFYNEVVDNLTDNTLFNQYWFKYVELISESKLLTAFFDLNEYDISTLDFAKLVWIRDSYWYLNRVIDYDANNPKLTKVELIKALDYPKFSPKKITKPRLLADTQTNTPWNSIRGDRVTDNIQPGFTGNYNGGQNTTVVGFGNSIQPGTKNTRIIGNGNRVSVNSDTITIDGNNNFVGGSSIRIFIQGSNNTLFGGSANVSLINCNNLTLVNCVGDISFTNVDNQIIDFSSRKTFISEYIYIQAGVFVNNSQIVDAGLDLTFTPPSQKTFTQNLVDAGEDNVYVNLNEGAELLNGVIDGMQIDYEIKI